MPRIQRIWLDGGNRKPTARIRRGQASPCQKGACDEGVAHSRLEAGLTTGKDGSDRIVITARTYTAKYRDGSGIVREVPTGCRDETAARSVLADLERRAELVKAKVLTAAEDAVADHQDTPLAEHADAYLTKLEAEGTSPDHRGNVRRCLSRVAADCGFVKLADLKRDAFERWLVRQSRAGMGARTRNLHRASLVAFCNWCLATDRLVTNPFASVKKSDEDADRRRQRRALTEGEMVKLLEVARQRPLLDAMTIRRGKRWPSCGKRLAGGSKCLGANGA